MKKLFTKILFIVVLCFTGMSNVVQANSAADWGKPVLSWLSELKQHFAVELGLFYGKRAVSLVAAGAVFCGVVKFDRFWQSQSKNCYRQRYKGLYPIVFSACERRVVNEDTAQNIFESGEARPHKPKWYLMWKKIEFIEGFIKYCEDKREKFNFSSGDVMKVVDGEFRDKVLPNRDKAQKVLDMTTTYLGYLKKPWITKENLTFAATAGIALISVGNKIIQINFPFSFPTSAVNFFIPTYFLKYKLSNM